MTRNDTRIIHTDGLEEGIRCAMCTNPMANNRGCDGGCDINESMYKRVLDVIKKNILVQEPCEDCISRKAVLDGIDTYINKTQSTGTRDDFISFAELVVKVLPSVNPQDQKWIPVSERLPKIATVYRVTRCYPNNVMNPYYLVDACFFDGSNTWYNDNRINHERAYVDNVIAWQENPEPFEPQESEG